MHCVNDGERYRKSLVPFLLGLLMVTVGCGGGGGSLREDADPVDRIFAVNIEEGKVIGYSMFEIPERAFSREPLAAKLSEEVREPGRPEKIHPLLRDWLAERDPGDVVRVVITFRDDLTIPRFPEPETEEPRDSHGNKKALARAREIVMEIERQRAERYAALTAELNDRYQARVSETFWLISGLQAELPLGRVEELAAREDIQYIEPEESADEPPQNDNDGDDVADGRDSMQTDPYFHLGLDSGWIGLLDTGMRFTHALFESPARVDLRRDCVNGGPDCNTGDGLDPTDDCWNHGTASGAVIMGNENEGTAYRGVTGIVLDSFKVYPGRCGSLSTTAAVRGFQAAVAVLDRVIVAEMQSSGSDLGAISTAADNAFDTGSVVIAANGNRGPHGGSVNAPANAHRVIGVGAIDVQTRAQIGFQSRGPTRDGRTKPDIQAPTGTEAACATADQAFKSFGGTSGATAYAAGAAALLRNWLKSVSQGIDPGQVYAQLILSGQHAWPFDDTSGAGPLRLPTSGWAWWGKTRIADGVTLDIPVKMVGEELNTLDGALWWPESAQESSPVKEGVHNDIDMLLIDPGGVERGRSDSVNGVYERVQVAGQVTEGTWKLRIIGHDVEAAGQIVYWSAHVRRQ